MISRKDFFLAEDVYQSSFNFVHVGCDNFDWDNVDCDNFDRDNVDCGNFDWDNVDCDGVVNCPTQPTCISQFDLCICQLYFITNLTNPQ